MQLFYNKDIKEKNTLFTFNKEESKHIIKVLRKQENDTIFITNGKGFLFTSIITNANEKKCQVTIKSFQKKNNSLPYKLNIAIAPTKNIQRLEWFLEKATEIGITEITPLICNHSERKVIKKERLEKVIISAMKQSLKYVLPKLNDITSFSEFIKNNKAKNSFIAHCINSNKNNLKHLLSKTLNQTNKPNVTILIGPEGDFTPNEINLALQNNFKALSLGNSRLRTETAGIVAASNIAFIFNEKINK